MCENREPHSQKIQIESKRVSSVNIVSNTKCQPPHFQETALKEIVERAKDSFKFYCRKPMARIEV